MSLCIYDDASLLDPTTVDKGAMLSREPWRAGKHAIHDNAHAYVGEAPTKAWRPEMNSTID
jgi:hypothetical protein